MMWPAPDTRSVANHWRQTTNPVTATSRGVTGYDSIKIDHSGHNWGGLEQSGSSPSLLDGSVSTRNWFYAVGAQQEWRGGIPAYASSAVHVTELYVCVERGNIAAPRTTELVCDGGDNETVIAMNASNPTPMPYRRMTSAQCEEETCMPMRLENGGVEGDCDGGNGDACTYTGCDLGFRLSDSGEMNRTCGNRAYSGVPKRCVPITCPAVRLENGQVAGSCNGAFNSTCSYLECDPGYRTGFGGTDTRTCGEDGTYSGEAKRCARDLRTVGGICSSTGDPHFNSFDNRHFHYQTVGLHHLVRSVNLNVQVRHSRVRRGGRASINTWVAVSGEGMANDVLEVYTGASRGEPGVVLLNRRSVPWSPSSFVRHDNASEIMYTLEILQNRHITLTLNDTARVLISGDSRRFFNIYVTLPGTYRADDLGNGTSGLCGRFDGDRSTDPTDNIRIDDPCQSLFSAFEAECDPGGRGSTTTPRSGITIFPPGGDSGGGGASTTTARPGITIFPPGGDPGGGGLSSTVTPPGVTLPPLFTICVGGCDDGGGFFLPPPDWSVFDVDDDSLAVQPPGDDQAPTIDEFDPSNPDDCSPDHLASAQRLCSAQAEEPEAHLDCLNDICLTLGGEEAPGPENATATDVNELVLLVQDMARDAVSVGGAEVDHVAESNAVKCPRLNLLHGSVAGSCDGKLADACVYEKCDLGFQLSASGDSARMCMRLNTTDAITFALANDTTVPGEYDGAQKQCLMEPTLSLATGVGRSDSGNGVVVTRDEAMVFDVEMYVPRGEGSAHVAIELPHWVAVISSEIMRVGEHIVEPVGGLQIVDERRDIHDNTFVLDIGTVRNDAGVEPGVAPPPITSADGVRVRVSTRITNAARTADAHFVRAAMLAASTRVTGPGVSVTVAEPAVDITMASPEHVSGGDLVSISTEFRNLGSSAAYRFQATCQVPGIIVDTVATNSSEFSIGPAVQTTHSLGEDAASSEVMITFDSLEAGDSLVFTWQGQAVDGLEAGANMVVECDTYWHSLSYVGGINYQTIATGEISVSPIIFGFDQGDVEVATESGAAIGIPFGDAASVQVTVAVPPGTIITNYSLGIKMSNPAFIVKTVELLGIGAGIELHTDGLSITKYDPDSGLERRARRDVNASVGESGGDGAVRVSVPEVRSRLNVSGSGPGSGSEGGLSVAANEIVFVAVIENSAARPRQRWQGQSAVLKTTMTSAAGVAATSVSEARYVAEEPDIHVGIVSSVDGDGDVVFHLNISHSVQSTAEALNVTAAVALNASTMDPGRLVHSSPGGEPQIDLLMLRQTLQRTIVVGRSDGMQLQGEVCIEVSVSYASLGNDYVAAFGNCRLDLTTSTSTTVPANLQSSGSSSTDETGILVALVLTPLLLIIVLVALVFWHRRQHQIEARNVNTKGTPIPLSTLDRMDQREVLPGIIRNPGHRGLTFDSSSVRGSMYMLDHPTADESTVTDELAMLSMLPVPTSLTPSAPYHEPLNDTREFAVDSEASSIRLKSVARTNPVYVDVPLAASLGNTAPPRSSSYAEALDEIATEDLEASIIGTSVQYRGGTSALETNPAAATIQRSTATLMAGEKTVEPAEPAAEAGADSTDEGDMYEVPSLVAPAAPAEGAAPALDAAETDGHTDGAALGIASPPAHNDEGAPAVVDGDDEEDGSKYGVVLSGPRAAATTSGAGVSAGLASNEHSLVSTPVSVDGHQYEYDGQYQGPAAGAYGVPVPVPSDGHNPEYEYGGQYHEPAVGAEPDYDRPAGDETYANTAAVSDPIYGISADPSAGVYGLDPSAGVYGLDPSRPTSELYQMADHSDAPDSTRNYDDNADNAEFYPMAGAAEQNDAGGASGATDSVPGPAYSVATFDRRGSGGGYRAPEQRAVTGDYSNVVIGVDGDYSNEVIDDGVYGLKGRSSSTYGNSRPSTAEGEYGLGN